MIIQLSAGFDSAEGCVRQGKEKGPAHVQGQRLRQSEYQAAPGSKRQRGISHQAQKRCRGKIVTCILLRVLIYVVIKQLSFLSPLKLFIMMFFSFFKFSRRFYLRLTFFY